MLELLSSLWAFSLGLLAIGVDLLTLLSSSMLDALQHLHNDAPRLEGLLVGVALSWLLLRRDKHPLLRVLSAPLKLIVDILDLAWDQLMEVVGDVRETGFAWVKKAWSLGTSPFIKAWSFVMGGLKKLKDKLKKSKK